MRPTPQRRYDAEPLAAILKHVNTRRLAFRLQARFGTPFLSEVHLIRRIKTGEQPTVTEDVADRLAVGLGLHPAIIWPDWVERASE